MTDAAEETLLERVVPNYPEGRPELLRAAADAWRTVAHTIDSERQGLDSYVASASGTWQGEGYDAFREEWSNLSGRVSDGCGELRNLADRLDTLATDLENAKRAYDAALVAAGVTVAVGLAFTVLTFGASAAATAGEVAVEVGVAVTAAEAASATAAISLAAIADIVADLATMFTVGFGVSLGSQMIGSAVVYPDHNPFDHLSFQQMVITGAGFAVLGPLAEGLAGVTAGSVAGTAALRIGGMTIGAGTFDAAVQEITTGHIDPGQVLFAGATAGVFTAVGFGIAELRALPEARQQALLDELRAQGTKVNEDELIFIGRDGSGRIVFLEEGWANDGTAGLGHITWKALDFAKQGIPPEQLPRFIFEATTKGQIIGYQGSGMGAAPRPVYEVLFNGTRYRVAVTIGDNGYIVGANPISMPDPSLK